MDTVGSTVLSPDKEMATTIGAKSNETSQKIGAQEKDSTTIGAKSNDTLQKMGAQEDLTTIGEKSNETLQKMGAQEKYSLPSSMDGVLGTSKGAPGSTQPGRKPEYHDRVESANACVGTGNPSVEDRQDISTHLSSTAAQVFVPFVVAGIGSVIAGILLDEVKDWSVFQGVRELFVLIPPLLGLNGNLEQTLVARLGTQANLGRLNTLRSSLNLLVSNLALLQCQATIASSVACTLAMFKGLVLNEEFEPSHAGIIFASALAAVNTSSFVLGCIMSTVVFMATKCNKNPDNIAPAIASSFGDLTTLFLLSASASLFQSHPGLTVVMISFSVLTLPLWIVLARRNEMSKEVLRVGWLPIIAALTASSFGGYILDYAVVKFPPIALHLSTVNALGGNLASVYSCSLSSYLSRYTKMGELPAGERVCIGPLQMYYGSSHMAHVAVILLGVVVPGQTLFAVLSKILRFGYVSMTIVYYVIYMAATLSQVVTLLYMGRLVVYGFWKLGIDPDNAAIPFLTGCGDFLGTGFLTIAYELLAYLKDDTENLEQNIRAFILSQRTTATAVSGLLNTTVPRA